MGINDLQKKICVDPELYVATKIYGMVVVLICMEECTGEKYHGYR